jgi:cellulose synthase/poly-beta-1,6-N-acetylglucosamine synthase-like glycosyltransferase
VIEILIAAILAYYVCLHGLYALLIALGATQLRRYQLGVTFGEYRRIAESPLTMPISLVIPAYNEEMVIVNTVLGALKLRYPQHEVIVVNDGSGDRTVAALVERFGMRSVRKVGQRHFGTQPVSRVFVSSAFPNLVVVDKANGRRADAINAGVNLARYPLLCIIDADSILERDALLHVVRPFQRNASVARRPAWCGRPTASSSRKARSSARASRAARWR